jgi:hypothetical protein
MKVFSTIMSFLFICVLSIYIDNYKIIITYLLFYGVLSIVDFFNNKTELIYYYNCYVFGSLALLLLFQLDHGTYWGNIDEELFYEAAIGQNRDGFYEASIRWVGYYFLLTEYYYFIREFIDSSVHFYHGILLSAFFSSFIPFFFKKHFYKKLLPVELNRLILILLFLPQFLIYNVTYLRDSLILLLFSVLVYFIGLRNRNILFRFIIIFFILALTFSIRPGSAIFLGVFVLFDLFFIEKNKYYLIIGTFILVVAIIAGNVNFRNPIEVSQGYIELTEREISSNSLGHIVLSSDNILLFPLKMVYILFSPIPPQIVYKVSIQSVFFTIGSFVKYFYLIAFLISAFKNFIVKNKDIYLIRDSLFVFFLVAGVLFTSRDQRHLNFLFPLVFYYGIEYSFKNKTFSRKTIFYSIVALPAIVTGYLFLKGY